MTEDMRERGVQSKWNELFVVETDRGEWIDMAGEGGWSAFSLLSEAQEIADSEDEPCKIVRFVRQAALSSAGTSGTFDGNDALLVGSRGDQAREAFQAQLNHRGDSLSGKGEATTSSQQGMQRETAPSHEGQVTSPIELAPDRAEELATKVDKLLCSWPDIDFGKESLGTYERRRQVASLLRREMGR